MMITHSFNSLEHIFGLITINVIHKTQLLIESKNGLYGPACQKSEYFPSKICIAFQFFWGQYYRLGLRPTFQGVTALLDRGWNLWWFHHWWT